MLGFVDVAGIVFMVATIVVNKKKLCLFLAIIAFGLLSTGLIMNEQAQAEYAKYETAQHIAEFFEDGMEEALCEIDTERNLPDMDRAVFDLCLQEGFSEFKEAVSFVAKVKYCNKRYWIFSKYWLLRNKVTDESILELL